MRRIQLLMLLISIVVPRSSFAAPYAYTVAESLIGIVDAATDQIVDTIFTWDPQRSHLQGVAIDGETRLAYLAMYEAVAVLDLRTRTVVRSIAANNATDLKLSPDRRQLYVLSGVSSATGPDQLMIIDT